MKLSYLLTILAGVALAEVSVPAIQDFADAEKISEDSFESGDYSGILTTYNVKNPEDYGCGKAGGSAKQEKHQIASLRTMVKEVLDTGVMRRIKVKEQLFNLEPARADYADSLTINDMREGCGGLDDEKKEEKKDKNDKNDKKDKDDKSDDSDFVLLRPAKTASRVYWYDKEGKQGKVEKITDDCHMPSELQRALLKPGHVFAIKLAGSGYHDDGKNEEFKIYLKNKLQELGYTLPVEQEQTLGELWQILLALAITAVLASVIGFGIKVFVKHTQAYRRLQQSDIELQQDGKVVQ